ncbi:hypothetical protein C9374_003095 [Naegleria lovaniensis]|uniref:Uncharacterized protein n=1 Tax=Naegleria lovaniensis TaxID=51637 RepID=A0AA88KM20_NAELO|nr:uncharacterized protein C9374_003095 [Naegleria lovaniensis]KAG2385946.1 hypothetical protein C9374_003095 [Naegleria lovaniensis]
MNFSSSQHNHHRRGLSSAPSEGTVSLNNILTQLLVGNNPSKNIFIVLLSSILSIYLTQYTTKKINSFRKLMSENPLFLVWGVLNVLSGRKFFDNLNNNRLSYNDTNNDVRQTELKSTGPRKRLFSLFSRNKQIQHVDAKPKTMIEETLQIDEDEIDEDIYYIKLYRQKNAKQAENTIPVNLGQLAVNAGTLFTRVKQYVTAEDILAQNQSRSATNNKTTEFTEYFINAPNETYHRKGNFNLPAYDTFQTSSETVLPKI